MVHFLKVWFNPSGAHLPSPFKKFLP